MPDPLAPLCRRALHTFAEALAVTPADELSHRQLRPSGKRGWRRATKREVLIDGMLAAADLLAMETKVGTPANHAEIGSSHAGDVS